MAVIQQNYICRRKGEIQAIGPNIDESIIKLGCFARHDPSLTLSANSGNVGASGRVIANGCSLLALRSYNVILHSVERSFTALYVHLFVARYIW